MSTQKKSSIERLPGPRVTCTVSFSEQQVEAAQEKALRQLGKDTRIKGFRPGKAPVEMLRQQIDAGDLLQETIRALLPSIIEQLMSEHGLKPIIPPKVEAQSRTPLTLTVTFVEQPDVALKGISKIKIAKREPKLEEKDIEQMIDFVLSKHRKTTPVDRAAQEGDQVTMSFKGTTEQGTDIPEITEEDYQVIIGSSTLLPGFEQQLTGLKALEEKSFTLTFPEKHDAEQLRGKPVTFRVKVKQVAQVEKPALTDAFAKQQLGAPSAEAFRTRMKQSMLEQEQHILRRRQEEELFDAIRGATIVELAPELVEEETRAIVQEIDRSLQQRGKTFDDWLKQQPKKPDEVRRDLAEQARKRLRLRLGMSKLIEERAVDITDEEMQQAIDQLLARLPEKDHEQLRQAYVKGQHAYEQLKWQKKVEKVMNGFLQ